MKVKVFKIGQKLQKLPRWKKSCCAQIIEITTNYKTNVKNVKYSFCDNSSFRLFHRQTDPPLAEKSSILTLKVCLCVNDSNELDYFISLVSAWNHTRL